MKENILKKVNEVYSEKTPSKYFDDESKSNKFIEIQKAIKKNKHLFLEYNGVGMNYYCGYKR